MTKEYKLSELEIKFENWLQLMKFYGYSIQHSPRLRGRRYRLDFAFPQYKIGIEIQGINYSTGYGHQNPTTIKKDYEKHNMLTAEGWRMFYFTGSGDSADSYGYLSEVLRSEISNI